MIYINKMDSPVGQLTLASDGTALTGLWLENQKYYASTITSDSCECSLPIFDQTRKWLEIYFSGRTPDFDIPLAPSGSEFRQVVWKILCTIPSGKTLTYGAIAHQIHKQTGKTACAQAVGGAVGHNPISILIPCHRVVGTNGSLTGYAGGIEKKVALLKLEGASLESLFIPKKGTAL